MRTQSRSVCLPDVCSHMIIRLWQMTLPASGRVLQCSLVTVGVHSLAPSSCTPARPSQLIQASPALQRFQSQSPGQQVVDLPAITSTVALHHMLTLLRRLWQHEKFPWQPVLMMSCACSDLPSMDNDDMRRNKPTNHKVIPSYHSCISLATNMATSCLPTIRLVKSCVQSQSCLTCLASLKGRKVMGCMQAAKLSVRKSQRIEQSDVTSHKAP